MEISSSRMERMARGIGCENCGGQVRRKTPKGHKCCESAECYRQLRQVEVSVGTPVVTPAELEEIAQEAD